MIFRVKMKVYIYIYNYNSAYSCLTFGANFDMSVAH